MHLSKLIEVENPQAETVSQKQSDAEQAQSKFEVKSVPQDSFDHTHVEALKDASSVHEALSLLRNLREGSQISDSAHESLSKVFKLLSKDKEDAASHSDKDDGTQSPRECHDAEMVDEAVDASTGMKVPKRKSASRPFKHPSSKRQQLTSEEAAEIYSMRPEFAKGSSLRRGCMVKSKMIAPTFGVTPKTVRDIWHARTWVSATRHLWTEEEIAHRAKGVVESDDEDRTDSVGSASPTGSMDSMKLPPFAQNLMALSSLQNQAMMGGMSGLPFHLPFPPTPSGLPFALGQQQAAIPGLFPQGMFNGMPPHQAPMDFPGCPRGYGMGAHNLVLPEVSASLLRV